MIRAICRLLLCYLWGHAYQPIKGLGPFICRRCDAKRGYVGRLFR